MRNFDYARAASLDEARHLAERPGAMLLAGGTTLLDLAKCGVAEPEQVIDITHLKGLDAVKVSGDGASIGGITRNHAVLGASESCIAINPGDLAVALVAFDAFVHLGERQVPVDEFFLLPRAAPEREHALQPGEMITAVTIPASPAVK